MIWLWSKLFGNFPADQVKSPECARSVISRCRVISRFFLFRPDTLYNDLSGYKFGK